MRLLGISRERLAAKGSRGLFEPHQDPVLEQGCTVFGRGYVLELQAAWPTDTVPERSTTADAPSRFPPSVLPRIPLTKPVHKMNAALSGYINKLQAAVKAQQVEAEAAKIAAAPPPAPPPALPPAPKPVSSPTLATTPETKPPAFPPAAPPPAVPPSTPAPAPKPAAPTPVEKSVSKSESQSVKVAVSSAAKNRLIANKRMQQLVECEEYKACLNIKELLTVVALEAEGLPKKLARTMASMAEQKQRLESTLRDVSAKASINGHPASVAFGEKLRGHMKDASPGAFVFTNELLKNVVGAYVSQAHQKSTVWGFAHFIALLLRSEAMRELMLPLWEYSLFCHTSATIPLWDKASITTAVEKEAIIRLYTAVSACLPDEARLWEYVASVVNDAKYYSDASVYGPEGSAAILSTLTAIVEIASPWLHSRYAEPWQKLVAVIRNELIPQWKALPAKPETLVRIVQLEQSLGVKEKPAGYSLSAREKDLAVDF